MDVYWCDVWYVGGGYGCDDDFEDLIVGVYLFFVWFVIIVLFGVY